VGGEELDRKEGGLAGGARGGAVASHISTGRVAAGGASNASFIIFN